MVKKWKKENKYLFNENVYILKQILTKLGQKDSAITIFFS